MDLFPTILELCGVGKSGAPLSSGPLDGLSLTPLLRDPSARLARDALFFHYPHYYRTTTPVSAVRAGDWKLLEYFEDNHVELYNLRDDPGEKSDLAATQASLTAQLQGRLRAWRETVRAGLPKPHPARGTQGPKSNR
jgi:arylsulfatase A-like enzyme